MNASLGAAVAMAFLWMLLRLTPAQFYCVIACAGTVALVTTVVDQFLITSWLRPIAQFLDAPDPGRLSSEELRAAFAASINVLWKLLVMYACGWTVAAASIDILLLWHSPLFRLFDAGLVVAACLAGGFISQVTGFRLFKRTLSPVRRTIAQYLPDPGERASLVHFISVKHKLAIATIGLIACSVAFGVALAQKEAMRSLERYTVAREAKLLDGVMAQIDSAGEGKLEEVVAAANARLRGDAISIVLVEDGQAVNAGEVSALLPDEWALFRSEVTQGVRGDSTYYDSQSFYSWQRISKQGPILLARASSAAVGGDIASVRVDFTLLVAFVIFVAGLGAWSIAADVSDSVSALSQELERIAAGDLTARGGFESEDELGRLGRFVDGTARALRGTVLHLIRASEGMDSMTAQINQVVAEVGQATRDQVKSVEDVHMSMEAIDQKGQAIASTAGDLALSSEESSSSVDELSVTGEQLSGNARSFLERVGSVSGSLDGMVDRIEQIAQGTEVLASAAHETSASMQQAVVAVGQAEAGATQTVNLSEAVILSADRGKEEVTETIEGMDRIRSATENAQEVIRGLGKQTQKIGLIVNVITDIADETNLLALNAAIISAQAGENGRAFSVVAVQIKKLADRVLQQTDEVTAVVQDLQARSDAAIQSIDEGALLVAEGVNRSAEAGLALEEIVQATRESGKRAHEILSGVQEQCEIAKHTMELMGSVNDQLGRIRSAEGEQTASTQSIRQDAGEMEAIARDISDSAENHARATRHIQTNISKIYESTEEIKTALTDQATDSGDVVQFMSEIRERTKSNESAVHQLHEAMAGLIAQSAALRENVDRFQVEVEEEA